MKVKNLIVLALCVMFTVVSCSKPASSKVKDTDSIVEEQSAPVNGINSQYAKLMMKVYQDSVLSEDIMEQNQSVVGVFNGKDTDRLTIFPIFATDPDGDKRVKRYLIVSEHGTTPELVIDCDWPSKVLPGSDEEYVNEGPCGMSYEYDGFPRLKFNVENKDQSKLVLNRYDGEGGSAEANVTYKLENGEWRMIEAVYECEGWDEKTECLGNVVYKLIDGKWVRQ